MVMGFRLRASLAINQFMDFLSRCGKEPIVLHETVLDRPGTDPELDLQKSRSSFGSLSDPFQNGLVYTEGLSDPIFGHIGSVWN